MKGVQIGARAVPSGGARCGLRQAGRRVRRPDLTIATEDHNAPTIAQDRPIADPVSRLQVDTLRRNCAEFGIRLHSLGDTEQGIVHVVGPQLGLTMPGVTVARGDSHTSTHGAFGAPGEPPRCRTRRGPRPRRGGAVTADLHLQQRVPFGRGHRREQRVAHRRVDGIAAASRLSRTERTSPTRVVATPVGVVVRRAEGAETRQPCGGLGSIKLRAVGTGRPAL